MSYPSLPIYEFVVTIRSSVFGQIIKCALAETSLAMSSGASLDLERVTVRGTRRVLRLTLRGRPRSFGAATEVKTLLSSMNFVERSASNISCGGSIGIRYLWKLRDLPCLLLPGTSGSPAICIPGFGIP